MKQLTNRFPQKLFNRISTNQQRASYFEKFLVALLILGGIGAIALAMAADLIGRGGLSGFGARQFMLVLSGLSLIGTGVTIGLSENRKCIGEWFLIGVATITVAMAADLIIINTGLPRLGDKVLGLATVVIGIGLIRLLPGLPVVWENRENLPELLVSYKSSAGQFFIIAIQLGFLVAFIQQFNLEN